MVKNELRKVNIDEIEIGDRCRSDYGNINELSASIKKDGLIQPLAVKLQPDAEKPYLLLAGGRRMRALELAGETEVSVNIFESEMDKMQQLTIELAENSYRKDLDFREYTSITAQIHRLQQEREGIKVSTSPDAPGWSAKDTANLLGTDTSTVNRDLQINQMLETSPELFEKCKTKGDALKVVKKEKEKAILEELGKRAQAAPKEGEKQMLMDAFMNIDFFEGIKNIPDESIDLVELDPPYAIDLKQRKQGYQSNYGEYNEIDNSEYVSFIRKVLKECYRVMSKNSWIISWYAQEPWQEVIFNELQSAGFKGNRLFGVWTKLQAQTNQPNYYLANAVECFYYMRKGDAMIAQPGRLNNFTYPAVPPASKIHPTERPIELIQDILSTFGHPTMRVLVPFAGSGNTLLAAHQCGMKPIGYELVKNYRDSYLVRVHKL